MIKVLLVDEVRRAGEVTHLVGEVDRGIRVGWQLRHVPLGEEQVEQEGSQATKYVVRSLLL